MSDEPQAAVPFQPDGGGLVPALLAARDYLQEDCAGLLDSGCVLDPETGAPDRGTLDDLTAAAVARIEALIAQIDHALLAAGVDPLDPTQTWIPASHSTEGH